MILFRFDVSGQWVSAQGTSLSSNVPSRNAFLTVDGSEISKNHLTCMKRSANTEIFTISASNPPINSRS